MVVAVVMRGARVPRGSDPADEAAGVEEARGVEPGLDPAHEADGRPRRIPHRAGLADPERGPLDTRWPPCARAASRQRASAAAVAAAGGVAAAPAARISVTSPWPACATAASRIPAARAAASGRLQVAADVRRQHARGRDGERARHQAARLAHGVEGACGGGRVQRVDGLGARPARSPRRRPASRGAQATLAGRPSNDDQRGRGVAGARSPAGARTPAAAKRVQEQRAPRGRAPSPRARPPRGAAAPRAGKGRPAGALRLRAAAGA